MAKTFLYRWFGIGKLPAAIIDEYREEGIGYIDEGIRGTITYKDFRGGGRRSDWRRQWFAAAVVLTRKRFVAYRLRHAVIDVLLDDPRLREIEFSIEEPGTLAVFFDANLFEPDWKGRLEYRFRTPAGKLLVAELKNLIG